MDFKETQAIYLQIVDLVCDHIVTGKWKAQERIPSVRELGTIGGKSEYCDACLRLFAGPGDHL